MDSIGRRISHLIVYYRRVIFFGALASVIAAITLFCWREYRSHTLVEATYHLLEEAMEDRVLAINKYLNGQKEHLMHFATDANIRSFFENKKFVDKEAAIRFLDSQQELIDYKRLFFISEKGLIVFSSTPNEDLGKNITQHQPPTVLAQSFARALMTAVPDISEFGLDPVVKEQAFFILVPVFHDHIIVGVVAAQMDEEKVYKLVRDYHNLGITGETVLAKAIPNGAQMISPTRHAPDLAFKHQDIFHVTEMVPLKSAITGGTGSGPGVDYRQKKILAAWSYIPQAGWAIVVKQDVDEVVHSIRYLLFLLLFCILSVLMFFVLSLYLYRECITILPRYTGSFFKDLYTKVGMRPARLFFFFMMVITLSVFFLMYLHIRYQRDAIREDFRLTAQDKLRTAVYDITASLNHIESIAQGIAADLSAGKINAQNSNERMEKELNNHHLVERITVAYAPYEYKKTVTLYAPTLLRAKEAFVQKDMALVHDYIHTSKEQRKNWYKEALQFGSYWTNPFFDAQKRETAAIYAVPFYHSQAQERKPRGVIALVGNIDPAIANIQHATAGRTGYSFMIDREGHFIYHPIDAYVRDKKTIVDLAREQNSDEFNSIAQRMLAGKSGLDEYQEIGTGQKLWIAFMPVKNSQWVCAITFLDREAESYFSYSKQMVMWMLITFFLSLLFFVFFLTWPGQGRPIHVLHICYGVVGVLVLCLFFLWYFIGNLSMLSRAQDIVVTQQAGLDEFVEEKEQEAQRKNEMQPIPVTTGLFLYSLYLPVPTAMAFTARIWQSFDDVKYPQIMPGIQIPQAQKMTMEKVYDKREDDRRVVGWKIEAQVPQQYNYTFFPFDVNRITIPIEHSDITKNVMLVPDLSSYGPGAGEKKAGIDPHFDLSGYTIKETFFSYEPVKPKTTFGIKEYGKTTTRMQLLFNIVVSRNLLNPLILYFLPLLIVLFSLFAIFWLSVQLKQDENRRTIFAILGAYTGLFFALLLLHRNIREQYPVGDLLYIEYFFFYTYLTIFLLTVHAIIPPRRSYISYLLTIFFWPMQLLFWIITTCVIFF